MFRVRVFQNFEVAQIARRAITAPPLHLPKHCEIGVLDRVPLFIREVVFFQQIERPRALYARAPARALSGWVETFWEEDFMRHLIRRGHHFSLVERQHIQIIASHKNQSLISVVNERML